MQGSVFVVHNREHAEELRGDATVIPHGIFPEAATELQHAAAKQQSGLEGKFVLGHFGFLVPDKGIEEVLTALHQSIQI